MKFIILPTVFLFVIKFTNTATATTWNNRTSKTYKTIQAAINDAQSGDTIIVTGTYTENIQIDKPITLKAQGTPTIQAQNPYQPTITITANKTTITGFTITNSTYAGIYLQNAKNCKITNNNITNNGDDGIDLRYSSNNTISNNKITNNGLGIDLSDSEYNKIYNNNITNNDYDGIDLRYSSNNNMISNNNITNNNGTGIFLYTSGIFLYNSSNNTISNNTIKNNGNDGILLDGSSNNKIYRNSFIGNGVQAQVDSGTGNLFNLAKPTGGNYWSDYTGTDLNDDGFGDTPYTFTGGQDNLPLIPQPKITNISPTNGTVSVPSNKTIIITFNQNILQGPGYANITVKMANGTAKALNKTITGNKLYISSINGWNPGVKFTITIPKNAIKNSIGSMLASDFKSSFVAAS